MAEFLMPFLGADMSAGTLTAWLKKPGDTVERGDIIAVVETDKADIEVEVFSSGVIEQLLVGPGTTVPVGTPLAVIRGEGEVPAVAPVAPPPGVVAPVAVAAAPPPRPAVPPPTHRLLISPSARQLAEELRVDLATVTGTGPGGRIQRKDVEAAAAARAAAPAEDRQAPMRQAVAAAMSRSNREIPHFYVTQTVDMSRALAWLAETNEQRPVTGRLLYGVLLLKAVALALREVPELNGFWKDGRHQPGEAIHVGVAVSLRGGGLVAPALSSATSCSALALARSRARRWQTRRSR
jgi:pyruvate dehydrogenase E2 component (dihydrolipoamide acetyltransferase)